MAHTRRKMEDYIKLSEKEKEHIGKVKTFKDLVFYTRKYHPKKNDEYSEVLEKFDSLKAIQTEKKNVGEYAAICESFIDAFGTSYYKDIHKRVSSIKNTFNIDKIDISFYDEAEFWYNIILRTQTKPKSWYTIAYLCNYNRTSFVKAYKKIKTTSQKADFVNEIDFFIEHYKKVLSAKSNSYNANCWYNDVITNTNLEALKIISFFGTFDIRKSIKDLHILSTEDMLANPNYEDTIYQYKQYLLQVYNGISDVIKTANNQYKDIITPVIPVPDLVVKDDTTDENDTNNIIKYVVEKLQEIDYEYYKNLSVDNYEEFINGTPEGISESMQQKRFNKIQDDIKKVIVDSPKLLDNIFENILWG